MSNKFRLDSARINVDADLVKAVLPFVAKNDVRYYLNGVCITPAQQGGALIMASDGHMLVCQRDPEGQADKPCIVPMQAGDGRYMKRMHRLAVGDDNRPWVCNELGETTWISPSLEIDGKFPPVGALVGDLSQYREGLVGTFNPLLIDRIRKAARGKYSMVRFYHRVAEGEADEAAVAAQNRAALFTMGQTGFGLLMPLRTDRAEVHVDLATAVPSDFDKAA